MNSTNFTNGRSIQWEVLQDHSQSVRFSVELGEVREILDEYLELDFDPRNCNAKQFGTLMELVDTVGC